MFSRTSTNGGGNKHWYEIVPRATGPAVTAGTAEVHASAQATAPMSDGR